MARTGRRIAAPALDLVELTATSGLKHLAMVHRETWRGHPLIGSELQPRLGFMEQPETPGICRLVAHEADSGTFVYPTGTVWTVAEIVRTYAENGSSPGVKAGLELCYQVAEALVEAAEAGYPQGVHGHGNINPWTVALKGDGQPTVIGYGIPQVEIVAWREDPRTAMVEDSFRYAPPERIEGGEEDVVGPVLARARRARGDGRPPGLRRCPARRAPAGHARRGHAPALPVAGAAAAERPGGARPRAQARSRHPVPERARARLRGARSAGLDHVRRRRSPR